MRNPTTEKYLEDLGYSPEYEQEFPLNLIDVKAKLNADNPGRLGGKLDVNYAKSIAVVLDKWDDIAAIVIVIVAGKLYIVGTGWHRIAAALKYCNPPRETLPAYIVRVATMPQANVLVRSLNSTEGHGQEVQERRTQIMELLSERSGRDRNELATRFGVGRAFVDDCADELKFNLRAKRDGLDKISLNLTQGMKKSLCPIQSSRVFDRAVRLVAKYPRMFRGKVAAEMLQALDAEIGKSERKALDYLANYDRHLSEAGDAAIKEAHASPSDVRYLYGQMTAVRNLVAKETLYENMKDEDRKEGFLKAWEELAWNLSADLMERLIPGIRNQMEALQEARRKPWDGKPRSALFSTE